MSVTTLPIDDEIAVLRDRLSDKVVRSRAVAAGLPQRTIQHFLSGGQPSVKTIRVLQSVARDDEPIPSQDGLIYEMIALAARARHRADSIDETARHVHAILDRLEAARS